MGTSYSFKDINWGRMKTLFYLLAVISLPLDRILITLTLQTTVEVIH